ncbi:hypothetical protein HELRODRAFT_192697, partial [Helobdella robusta]|uniref:Protein SZT2 n=1 Tax=Helobdella robusta TaxID=6412 RepID=T1FU74_HELRO
MKEESLTEDPSQQILSARRAYVLMKNGSYSKNEQLNWFFRHLNKVIMVNKEKNKPAEDDDENFEVLSALPLDNLNYNYINPSLNLAKLIPTTQVTFLADKYTFVFMLHCNPSMATIDFMNSPSDVLFAKLYQALSNVLTSLAKGFCTPGSSDVFMPEITISILIFTSVASCPMKQVLLHGCRLTSDNVDNILANVKKDLNAFEDNLSLAYEKIIQSQIINNNINNNNNNNYKDDGSDYHINRPIKKQVDADSLNEQTPTERCGWTLGSNDVLSSQNVNKDVISSDKCFSIILRHCLLLLKLQNHDTSNGIVIITDGVMGTSDSVSLEQSLQQLRSDHVALSFVQVGSLPSPLEGLDKRFVGNLPNVEFMHFVSLVTDGSLINSSVRLKESGDTVWNVVHRGLLCRDLCRSAGQSLTEVDHDYESSWLSASMMLSYIEYSLSSSVMTLLSCRVKEGYLLSSVCVISDADDDTKFGLHLVLPWRSSIFVHYYVEYSANTNVNHKRQLKACVTIEAPSQFITDLYRSNLDSLSPTTSNSTTTAAAATTAANTTAAATTTAAAGGGGGKPGGGGGDGGGSSNILNRFKYPSKILKRFVQYIKTITVTDKLLAHIYQFNTKEAYYNMSDGLRSGVPVLVSSSAGLSSAERPVVNPYLVNANISEFIQFWKQLTFIDTSNWMKWFTVRRFDVLLEHDEPLSKHIQMSWSKLVHCRQARDALSQCLQRNTSFVLVEGLVYIGFLYGQSHERPPSDKIAPSSFFIVRLELKSSYIIVHVFFLGDQCPVKQTINRLKSEFSKLHIFHKCAPVTLSKVSQSKKTAKFSSLPQRKPHTSYLTINKPLVIAKQLTAVSTAATASTADASSSATTTTADTTAASAAAATTVSAAKMAGVNSSLAVFCCHVLEKLMEKIQISYDKAPTDFSKTKLLPILDRNNAALSATAIAANPLASISNLLCHKRWIWSLTPTTTTTNNNVNNKNLNNSVSFKNINNNNNNNVVNFSSNVNNYSSNKFHSHAASSNNNISSFNANYVNASVLDRILYNIIRLRLEEGFHFLSCNPDVIKMAAEFDMVVATSSGGSSS